MKRSMIAVVSLVAVAAAVVIGTAAIPSPVLADTFWGASSPDWEIAGPALFKFDTADGTVQTAYSYTEWNWIMAVQYAPGGILYASHSTVADPYTFSLAKVNAATGVVLSDTPIKNLTGTDYPQWNALEYYNGKLYGIENNPWGSAYTAGQKRGYVYQVTLDGSGDPVSAALGAYVGGAPDGALAFHDGVFYASDWKSATSSYIKTTSDVMATNFAGIVGTTPVGYIAGWDFESDGDLLGVTWNYDFNVYKINLTTGAETTLYNLKSQLDSQLPGNNLTMYGGLTTPEPATMALLALGGIGMLVSRKRSK